NHRVTTEHPVEHRFFDAFLDRGNIFARNHAADDLVIDHQTGTSASRTHVNFHVAVLSATAGLLNQFPDALSAACDRLTIRDLWFACIRVHFELTEHA